MAISGISYPSGSPQGGYFARAMRSCAVVVTLTFFYCLGVTDI